LAKKPKLQKSLTGYELAKDLCGIGHSDSVLEKDVSLHFIMEAIGRFWRFVDKGDLMRNRLMKKNQKGFDKPQKCVNWGVFQGFSL